MPINVPYRAQSAGIPSQWSDTIVPVPEGLIVGETPAVVTEDMTFAASQTIPAFTPVGFDGSGNLIPAVSGTTQAVGLTLIDLASVASIKGAPVLRAGCLSMDMIAWPASYNTDERKLEAFRGAPTPTNIVVRKVYLGALLTQP